MYIKREDVNGYALGLSQRFVELRMPLIVNTRYAMVNARTRDREHFGGICVTVFMIASSLFTMVRNAPWCAR
ncbi:MAG: hypothetical protein ACYDEV_16505 [Acidiferrobacter sp.]